MESTLSSLRPQLEKIKISLLRRLPAMQDLYDKVSYVLEIPSDTAVFTDEQKSKISSLKKDVQAYIRERASKAGILEDLSVHIQRIRDGNQIFIEIFHKTSWNSSSIKDILTILTSLKAYLANWAISYPLLQLGVKSTLDVIKQVTTTCNEYLNTPISADAIITLQEQSATVASMIRYILTYASTQEIFLKKSVSGAQNNSINSINT